MKRLLIAGAAVLAGLVVWLAIRGRATDGAPPAAASAERVQGDGAARLEGTAAGRGRAVATPGESERTELAMADDEAMAETASASATATVRGRCVDAAGRPLAGVRARLRGVVADAERAHAYAREHGAIEWQDPAEQLTATGGEFAFTFVPPPPYQFGLDLRRDDLVPLYPNWGEIESGVRDLGDLVMTGGCRVHGLVVDTEGASQGDAALALRHEDDGRGRDAGTAGPSAYRNARAGPDGTFAFADLFAAGTWRVHVSERQTRSPETFTVVEGQGEQFVHVVVRRAADAELITGVVVDDRDRPVADVTLVADTGRSLEPRATSRNDGTFRLEKNERDPPDPVRLRVRRRGFEDLDSSERYAWGTHDVRVALRRGLTVEVRVTDADTGAPIEEYGVRLGPVPGTRRVWGSRDFDVREQGRHAGGICVVGGVLRGPHLLRVEPRGETWEPSEFVWLDVTDEGAPVQHVRLGQTVARTVLVRRGGVAVAGTTVELLVPFGRPVDEGTFVPPPGTRAQQDNRALLAHQATTDARGEARIRGSAVVRCALRVRGSAHGPVVRDGVVLGAEPDPIVIDVPLGATVRGRITPAVLVQQFRREAGLPETGPVEPERRALLPGLRMSRKGDSGRVQYPSDDLVRIGDDGTFVFEGVPAGSWQLTLVSTRVHRMGSATGVAGVAQLENLREGEVRVLDLVLDDLLRATVRGTVALDGVRYAGTVDLVVDRQGNTRGLQRQESIRVEADAEGAFTATLPSGRLRVQIQKPEPGGQDWVTLMSDEDVVLVPGQEIVADFHVRARSVRLRARDANGAPVAAAQLSVSDGRGTGIALEPTDGAGTTAKLLHAGTWHVHVVRKRFASAAAREEFYAEHAGDQDAWTRLARVEAGGFVAEPGADEQVVDITLPAESGY